jgi:hypothetical protein
MPGQVPGHTVLTAVWWGPGAGSGCWGWVEVQGYGALSWASAVVSGQHRPPVAIQAKEESECNQRSNCALHCFSLDGSESVVAGCEHITVTPVSSHSSVNSPSWGAFAFAYVKECRDMTEEAAWLSDVKLEPGNQAQLGTWDLRSSVESSCVHTAGPLPQSFNPLLLALPHWGKKVCSRNHIYSFPWPGFHSFRQVSWSCSLKSGVRSAGCHA